MQIVFVYAHKVLKTDVIYIWGLCLAPWATRCLTWPTTRLFVHTNNNGDHYNDVIMGTMASQITSLTIVYSTVIQAPIKENIKAPRHWPLCGTSPGPVNSTTQRAGNAENVSIWWRHHASKLRITGTMRGEPVTVTCSMKGESTGHRESTSHRWIPLTNGKYFHAMTSSCHIGTLSVTVNHPGHVPTSVSLWWAGSGSRRI